MQLSQSSMKKKVHTPHPLTLGTSTTTAACALRRFASGGARARSQRHRKGGKRRHRQVTQPACPPTGVQLDSESLGSHKLPVAGHSRRALQQVGLTGGTVSRQRLVVETAARNPRKADDIKTSRRISLKLTGRHTQKQHGFGLLR